MRKHKYKVIKKKSRMSAVINGRSKYARKYIKGEITYALEGTLGIMVFITRRDAQSFINNLNVEVSNKYGLIKSSGPYIIVRVLSIGRGQTVKTISGNIQTYNLDLFYSHLFFTPTSQPPPDTMGYPGVFVVD